MDAWLNRMFASHRDRYVARMVLLAGLLGTVTIIPGVLLVPALYEGMSAAETLFVLVIGIGTTWVMAALGFALHRRRLRALAAWLRGERDPETTQLAVDAAFRGPALYARTALAIGFLVPVPAMIWLLAAVSGHETALDLIEIGVGSSLAFLFCVAGVYLVGEMIMGPIRATFARAEELEKGGRHGLPERLLIASLGLAMTCASAAGLFQARRSETGAGGMLEVFAIALGGTLLVALVLTPLVSGTVLGPIRNLMAGTRAVGAGDLDVVVPVTTADELGALAASFNRMVAGLREREQLRGHNAELVEELRASRARIVAAADEARRQVERDLHDGAQQSLVLLNLKLGMLERRLAGTSEEAAVVAGLREELEAALAELRDLAHGIYPQVLTSAGLGAALRAAVPERVRIAAAEDRRYPPEVEAAVYFCCFEAIQNASKYAGDGAVISVGLTEREDELRFEVADDGAGFDPGSAFGSAGLQNMRDRIGALGGEVLIESAPGAGTRVAGRVPISTL